MITSTLKGTYHKGKFELEKPIEFEEKVEVVVIFLQSEKKQENVSLASFFGLWKNMPINWDKEIKNIRSEWERDI